jgi:Flp pilus assembly protein TadG
MEETVSTPDLNVTHGQPASPGKHHTFSLVIVLLIIAVGTGVAAGVYYLEQAKAKTITDQNSTLGAQALTLNKEIKQQNDINNGIVPASQIYKDPAGGIGLVNGAITLTLPKGWVRVPQNNCTGGTIDSTAVCQDITAVAPSNLVNSDGTAKWSVNIGVFSYNSSDGSAQNWYETKYDGSPLVSYGTPQAINISTTPISGYSALSFQFVSPPLDNPDYTNAHYAVVNGKYAVEVDAQVQAGAIYGTSAFDYRATYLPQITQMMQTIRFQG